MSEDTYGYRLGLGAALFATRKRALLQAVLAHLNGGLNDYVGTRLDGAFRTAVGKSAVPIIKDEVLVRYEDLGRVADLDRVWPDPSCAERQFGEYWHQVADWVVSAATGEAASLFGLQRLQSELGPHLLQLKSWSISRKMVSRSYKGTPDDIGVCMSLIMAPKEGAFSDD
jgi:hypothetical protein